MEMRRESKSVRPRWSDKKKRRL